MNGVIGYQSRLWSRLVGHLRSVAWELRPTDERVIRSGMDMFLVRLGVAAVGWLLTGHF